MGCGREMAIIAALRTSRRLFYRPQAEAEQADAARKQFETSNLPDLLNLVNVYEQAERANFDSKWCRDNYVSWLALREVRQNHSQLLKQVKRSGYKINKEKPAPEILCQAIAKGFPDKVFESAGRGWYRNRITDERALLGRESRATGNLIVANELITIQTKRGGELPLITLATKVEPEWIK